MEYRVSGPGVDIHCDRLLTALNEACTIVATGTPVQITDDTTFGEEYHRVFTTTEELDRARAAAALEQAEQDLRARTDALTRLQRAADHLTDAAGLLRGEPLDIEDDLEELRQRIYRYALSR